MAKVLGTFRAVERYVLKHEEVDHRLTASALRPTPSGS